MRNTSVNSKAKCGSLVRSHPFWFLLVQLLDSLHNQDINAYGKTDLLTVAGLHLWFALMILFLVHLSQEF